MNQTRRITCLAIALSAITITNITQKLSAENISAESIDNVDLIPYQAFIKDTLSEVDFLLNDKNTLNTTQKIEKLNDIWQKRFASKLITRFVLGKYSRQANEQDINRFEKIFTQVNSFSLIERLKSVKEKSYSFGQSQKMKGNTVLVSTKFVTDDGKNLDLKWRVVSKNGNYKIIDISIANISMIQTFRNEYNAYLKGSKGDINALTADLEKQLVKIKERP